MLKPLRMSLFALAWLGGSAWAEVKIAGETKVAPNHIVRLSAAGAPDGAACLWDVSPEDAVDIEEVGSRFLFAAPPGTYKVKLRTVVLGKDGKTAVETARVTVVIGEPTPPTPPVPPTPPTPPTPPPSPAPIPLAGFRVLMVYESAEVGKLPAAQQAVFFNKGVRDYLNAKCVTGEDGKTKEWRMWDKDVDPSAEAKSWQDVMKRERKSVPWIVISDGKTGFEGPLPATVDDALALLKKYGG